MSTSKKTTTTVTAKAVNPVQAQKKRARRRKRPAKPANPGGGAGGSAAEQFTKRYITMLEDPFNAPPVTLGFGTMVPTTFGIARWTGTVVTNATDGSGLLFAVPNMQCLGAWSSELTTAEPIWNDCIDSSYATATSTFSTIRPLALGARLTPLTSNNDKPTRAVVVDYGYKYNDDGVAMTTLQHQHHSSWFSSHLGTKVILPSGGSKTLTASWRPQDNTNFEFDECWYKQNNVSGNHFPNKGPIVVVSVVGPPSITYDIEIVFLYEGLSGINTVDAPSVQSAASSFSSIDTFFQAIRPHLTMKNMVTLLDVVSGSGIGYHQSTKLMKTMQVESFNRSQSVEHDYKEPRISENYTYNTSTSSISSTPIQVAFPGVSFSSKGIYPDQLRK